ncbi:MAG: ABC transporter permease subunit [Treponema sp.]
MKTGYGMKIYVIGSAAAVVFSACFLMVFIAVNGVEKISMEFLFTAPKGFGINEGGIFPAIISSLYLGGIAGITGLVCALPVSLSMHFFIRSRGMRQLIRILIHALAAVPSIILGLFGYAVFVKYMHLGKSLIAGGLTLGMMIFPFLEQRIEKVLNEIDESLIFAAYSAGLSKRYTILHIVLPLIRNDIIRSTALYISFAMGAAAPIILTAAVLIAPVPKHLTDPVMALPNHLYILVSEGIDIQAAYASASVLLLLVLGVNAAALLLSRSRKI